jgi:hypothetical protein
VTKAPNKGDRERTRDNERELGLRVKVGNNSITTTMYKGVYILWRQGNKVMNHALSLRSVHASECGQSSSRIGLRLRVLQRASESFRE